MKKHYLTMMMAAGVLSLLTAGTAHAEPNGNPYAAEKRALTQEYQQKMEALNEKYKDVRADRRDVFKDRKKAAHGKHPAVRKDFHKKDFRKDVRKGYPHRFDKFHGGKFGHEKFGNGKFNRYKSRFDGRHHDFRRDHRGFPPRGRWQ